MKTFVEKIGAEIEVFEKNFFKKPVMILFSFDAFEKVKLELSHLAVANDLPFDSFNAFNTCNSFTLFGLPFQVSSNVDKNVGFELV